LDFLWRARQTEYIIPESLKLIDLEETHELFDKAGFKKTRIFGIHQIDYVDPSKYLPTIESPQSLFRINLPPDLSSELVEVVIKETKEETRALHHTRIRPESLTRYPRCNLACSSNFFNRLDARALKRKRMTQSHSGMRQ
jgi:hypothetical protein